MSYGPRCPVHAVTGAKSVLDHGSGLVNTSGVESTHHVYLFYITWEHSFFIIPCSPLTIKIATITRKRKSKSLTASSDRFDRTKTFGLHSSMTRKHPFHRLFFGKKSKKICSTHTGEAEVSKYRGDTFKAGGFPQVTLHLP